MFTFWQRMLITIGRFLKGASKSSVSFQLAQADWQAVFQDANILTNWPRQVEEAQSRIMSRLLRAYEAYERLGQRYTSLLSGVVRTVDFCEGLNPPSEEVRAIRHQLLSLLGEHGIVPWSPQVGEPVPEGCEIIGVIPSADAPPNTVKEVAVPGYLWKDGTILRRPGVVITRAPTEEVHRREEAEVKEAPLETMPEKEQSGQVSDTAQPSTNGG